MDTDGNDTESTFDYESDESNGSDTSRKDARQPLRFNLSTLNVMETSVDDPIPFRTPPGPISSAFKLRFERALREDDLYVRESGASAWQHCRLVLRDDPSQAHVLLTVATESWNPLLIGWLLTVFSWDHEALAPCLFAAAEHTCVDIVKRLTPDVLTFHGHVDVEAIEATYHRAYTLTDDVPTKCSVFETAGPHTSDAMLQDQFDRCFSSEDIDGCRRIFFLTHSASSRFRPVKFELSLAEDVFMAGDVVFFQAIAAAVNNPVALMSRLGHLHIGNLTRFSIVRWVFAFARRSGFPLGLYNSVTLASLSIPKFSLSIVTDRDVSDFDVLLSSVGARLNVTRDDTNLRVTSRCLKDLTRICRAAAIGHALRRTFSTFQTVYFFRAPTAAMRHRFLGQ